jgi:phosphoglycerol transferase MdoB-like AlkP superfamily enzyme
MLYSFGSSSVVENFGSDFGRMFSYGLRFDLKVAAIAHSPFLVIGLLLLPWPSRCLRYLGKLQYVASCLGVIAVIAAVTNYYYYATYGTHFDVFIFGMVEEDTRAVLKNIWDDYPVLRFAAGTVVAGVIIARSMKYLWNLLDSHAYQHWSRIKTVIITITVLLAYSVAARGSIGTFPLRKANSQVSSNNLLNMVTMNSVMALYYAFGAHKKDSIYPIATDDEGQKLFSMFYGNSIPKSEVSMRQFSGRTPTNSFLEQNPPHVVFVVMESLSSHLLSYDAPPKRDFLGAWREYWQRDFTFNRFVSEANGTIDSLARLLVSSPVANISQSRVQKTNFESSMVRPYKLKGYRAIFITSGNGSYRNFSTFMKGIGFDEVIEQNDLVNRYAEAKLGAWGTFDEFCYRYAEELLEEADKKREKLFILILTTTNHPPYEVPSSFKQPPHDLDEQIRKRLETLPSMDALFASFQYANDAIGRFIGRVDRKDFGKQTLIAVTGDHNMRHIGYPDPKEYALKQSVPFYLHIPLVYRQSAGFVYDRNRVGSHKDILPTLYSLSLSDVPYFRRGVNLFANEVAPPWYFAYNEELALTEHGAYQLRGVPAFYPWLDDESLFLAPARPFNAEQKAEHDRFLAYKALLTWQINRQVNNQK